MRKDLDKITFNQRLICFLSGQNTSTISRYMSEKKIPYIAEVGNSRKRYSYEETRKVIKHYVADQVKVNKPHHYGVTN